MLVEDTNVRKVYTFTYPSGLTGEITLEQTNQAATQFTVNSATVVGNDVCLNITTDGKVRYNAKYDKTALPTATLPGDTSGEFCSAPLEGILDINGLQWLGSQTQIQKEIGGQVTQTGFTQSDNTFDVVNGFAGATAWQDDTECVLYGGDSVNLIGSNFTGNIDAFANSLQTYDFCVEACYCQPVAVETDANGNILNAYDVNGNPVDPNTVTLL